MAKKGKSSCVEFQGSSSSTTQLSMAESAQSQELETTEPSSKSWFKRVYKGLSPRRQIFCLFCIFDFLFTFLLWIIYAQGVAVTGLDDSLSAEIKHYGIKSSLFDIMILSFLRVTVLLFVYGYYKSRNILTVALTTFVSTVYLITKAFVFEFDDSDEDSGSRPVDYFLHIGSFVLVWIEVWYMRVKVVPREKRDEASIYTVKPQYGSIKPLPSEYSVLSFHTPPEQDSEEEEEVIRANLEYIETARKTTSKALTFLYAETSWNIEKQKAGFKIITTAVGFALYEIFRLLPPDDLIKAKIFEDDMLIESKIDEKLGKILRLRACINASQQVVHPMVFGNPENVKKWNTNISYSETIQKINSTTDIAYSSMAEIAGGLISARDFVTVNHYQRIGEMFMSSSTSVVSPIKPPIEGVIRGETILSSYALLPAENEPGKSVFVWIISTALKPGSIPQVFVDRSMPGFLTQCVTKLKKECEQLEDNANTPL